MPDPMLKKAKGASGRPEEAHCRRYGGVVFVGGGGRLRSIFFRGARGRALASTLSRSCIPADIARRKCKALDRDSSWRELREDKRAQAARGAAYSGGNEARGAFVFRCLSLLSPYCSFLRLRMRSPSNNL